MRTQCLGISVFLFTFAVSCSNSEKAKQQYLTKANQFALGRPTKRDLITKRPSNRILSFGRRIIAWAFWNSREPCSGKKAQFAEVGG